MGWMPEGPLLGMLGIGAMLAVMFLCRMPASFAMALVGFLGMAVATSWSAAVGTVGTEFWGVFSNYGFTVIPMFILVGELVFYAGYSDSLYHATDKWFGHLRGGLAISTICACAGFSAICGSNTATAATMGAVAIPAMRKYKYFPTLSAGAVAAGSTLGVMIPPSIVLVVYGLYTGQSIGKLFFGVIIPGLMLAALMAATVFLVCLRHPDWGAPSAKASWGDRLRALPGIIDVAVLFVVIMVALLSGKVTATEAAATSAFLALLICGARGKLSWKRLKGAIYDTLRISCMVFMIVAGATVFGRFMAVTRLPYEVAAWIGGSSMPGWLVLLMMLVCYALGGCIMDALAFLLISLPIFFPLAEKLGYDPIWFGVLLCLVTTLGAITPPVGICCFVVAGMNKDIPLRDVFKGAMYYIPAYLVAIALLMLFPKFMVSMLADLVR